MAVKRYVAVCVFLAICCIGVAQDVTCDQTALDGINTAQAEHSADIGALFAAIDNIKVEWETCQSSETAAQTDGEKPQMSASEVVDGGHIVEGLWKFHIEQTLSDACDERKKKITDEFFEDVYYNDDELLVWDAGNIYSNYTFEYLLATRYIYSKSNGLNMVYEREITDATETTMSGRWDGYWQGNKDFWCTSYGTFTAELFDTEPACLVDGEANIRTSPSTKSPKNGVIDDQRRVIGKVSGDDGYFWWKLSDDEYVREDVVTASRSCVRL